MTRLSRGEYWLLNHVLYCRFQLSRLADDEFITKDLNRTHHGLSNTELLDTLEGMFRNGWIQANYHDPDSDLVHFPTREEIRGALNDTGWQTNSNALYYSLTPTGGTVWEEFARPNWDRYLQVSDGPEDDDYSLIAINKSQIESYVKYAKSCLFEIIPDSEIWTQLTPHLLMDWKKVPNAWELTIKTKCTEGNGLTLDCDPLATSYTKNQLIQLIVERDKQWLRRNMVKHQFDYLNFYDWQ